SFVRAAHIVLGRLFHSAKFRSTPAGGLKDSDSFTLDFSVDTPTPTMADLTTIKDLILPGGTLKGNDYTVTASFLDIKNAFRTLISNTYSAKIAAATGATVFGALPATYTDKEKGVRLPLMIVPTKVPPYDDDLSANLKFYTTYLGATLDPEGLNY